VQQNLVLILARELADKLATAMFLVDPEGKLVYFNERAGEILGESFATVGRMDITDWTEGFDPLELDGRPLPPEKLPLAMALILQEPAHRSFRIRARDGSERAIAATAFPLFARADEFVGAAAIFWEIPENLSEDGQSS
jgi:PAS domain S-box-containing protein